MDLKEEDILGDRIEGHWYYVSKARALDRLIKELEPGSLLDVGAGSGVFSKHLLRRGWREAVCVDPSYPCDSEQVYAGQRLGFVRQIDKSSAGLVLMMDVCEHVDDDAGLIREYADKSAGGTHFLITVPAFQFLFSGHDEFLEHRRRYTIASLERSVRAAGLTIVASSYYFAAIFPLAAAVRLIERTRNGSAASQPKSSLRLHSAPVNAALALGCAVELPLLRLNRLFGLSVFCLARKPVADPDRAVAAEKQQETVAA